MRQLRLYYGVFLVVVVLASCNHAQDILDELAIMMRTLTDNQKELFSKFEETKGAIRGIESKLETLIQKEEESKEEIARVKEGLASLVEKEKAGICEPRTHDDLGKKDSQVGDLPEPFPRLFTALTSEKDPHLRWTSMTFPIDVNLSDLEGNQLDKNKYKTVAHPQDTAPVDQVTVNCTVLYMSQCMSGSKCKANCASTGATGYRWFFDGCCECVGGSCINYGVNENRCIECPMVGDDDAFDDDLTDQLQAGTTGHTLDEAALQGDIHSDVDPTL